MKNRNIFPNVDFLDKFTIHRFLATNHLSCIISVSCNKWNGLSNEELRAEHHQGDNGSRKKKEMDQDGTFMDSRVNGTLKKDDLYS